MLILLIPRLLLLLLFPLLLLPRYQLLLLLLLAGSRSQWFIPNTGRCRHLRCFLSCVHCCCRRCCCRGLGCRQGVPFSWAGPAAW
jgi:hypothetical protein